ncbi:TMhelix containing protein [Vibrio phage 1.246.O._10N.261.54.E10]|nr:TMhelix containing protein [Vibrio phage 1.246.O._10N.261.54.E10]
MNEQLQNAVATILERAITGIDSSVDFMQAELPEVIEQLLMWYAVKGVILIFIGFALMIPFIFVARKITSTDIKEATCDSFWVTHYDRLENSLGAGAMILSMLTGIASFFGLLIILANIMEPIQIWIAPKIWLMEYAASIVK